MCLDNIKKPEADVKNQKHWYKVVKLNKEKDCYTPMFYFTLQFKIGRRALRDPFLMTTKGKLKTSVLYQHYENGFHCYRSLNDAKEVAKNIYSWVSGKPVVIKVKVGTMTAFGHEGNVQVGVFRTITPIEEVLL